ncbi:MAG TPA: ribose-phosphate pyrophosphokinase [Pseudomonadota bacterium]|nr:ribose-phosphate pyrophosphokinase [Pseudomonadota bacterium]
MIKALSIFSGNSNRELAEAICTGMEVTPGNALVSTFSDGEIFVEIRENVRGVNCFVVQPTSSPVNNNLMELLIMIDALKRASAGSIVAIMPYFGYGRQDRKVKPRTPISAKLVADLITASGADRVVSVDLHAGQIQGFFDIPVDHLYAMPVFIEYLRTHGLIGDNAVAISPDAGGVERARGFAKRMESSMAIIDKRRPAPNISEVMNIIGDVRGKHAVIIDDMIDTAGTVSLAAKAVLDQGAKSVVACATHGVLSGPAIQRIEESVISEVIISDTIPLSAAARQCKKIKVLSVARLLGESIRRIHHGDSISSLFI